MKKYDSKRKKWVSVEEYERTHHKRDKDICRGQKPHNFVLVLPSWVSYTSEYKFNPEAYYELMDRKFQYLTNLQEQIKAMGVNDRGGWNREETRLYMCSVCKKQKYERE